MATNVWAQQRKEIAQDIAFQKVPWIAHELSCTCNPLNEIRAAIAKAAGLSLAKLEGCNDALVPFLTFSGRGVWTVEQTDAIAKRLRGITRHLSQMDREDIVFFLTAMEESVSNRVPFDYC